MDAHNLQSAVFLLPPLHHCRSYWGLKQVTSILESQPEIICLFEKFLIVMKESFVFTSLDSEMIKTSSEKTN